MVESQPGIPVVVDEFTSVVDRQVAKIGSHAVQKRVRRHEGSRFVAVSCHYDIIDWLQPDWTLEMPTMRLERRSVRPRPPLRVAIGRVPYATWPLFAPFHYLTASLNQACRCFCLFVDPEGNDTWRPAAFAATIHRPHAHAKNIEGLSRLVTLPDWQGLGLAFILSDTLGSAYVALGKRFHTYPAHPVLIRGYDTSPCYALIKHPGTYSVAKATRARSRGNSVGVRARSFATRATRWIGTRPVSLSPGKTAQSAHAA